MDFACLSELRAWLAEAGLAAERETVLLDGFCRRAVDASLPIARAIIVIDTLHPVHEGRAFTWRRDAADPRTELIEYGPTSEGEAAEVWHRSVFYHMRETGQSLFRVRFHAGEATDFPTLSRLRDEGMSDVAAMIIRFAGSGAIGEMDCLYSYWACDDPHGFADTHVEAIAGLMPMLALAVKCVSLARIAATLAETYLGRDAGQRVLKGVIRRGVADKISAVLWFSDLRGFTRISELAPQQQILPLLNDYAEAVISAIHDNGGDVLKLIGDGTLAIFAAPSEEACRSAITAHSILQERVAQLNQRRARDSLPTTHVYVGLHIGEVFYGNIGSDERLDFTVVGAAVNEAARIAAMCRSVERNVLLSQAFADAMARLERGRLVSVGRYALRGVERPQELFTLDPFWAS